MIKVKHVFVATTFIAMLLVIQGCGGSDSERELTLSEHVSGNVALDEDKKIPLEDGSVIDRISFCCAKYKDRNENVHYVVVFVPYMSPPPVDVTKLLKPLKICELDLNVQTGECWVDGNRIEDFPSPDEYVYIFNGVSEFYRTRITVSELPKHIYDFIEEDSSVISEISDAQNEERWNNLLMELKKHPYLHDYRDNPFQ